MYAGTTDIEMYHNKMRQCKAKWSSHTVLLTWTSVSSSARIITSDRSHILQYTSLSMYNFKFFLTFSSPGLLSIYGLTHRWESSGLSQQPLCQLQPFTYQLIPFPQQYAYSVCPDYSQAEGNAINVTQANMVHEKPRTPLLLWALSIKCPQQNVWIFHCQYSSPYLKPLLCFRQ